MAFSEIAKNDVKHAIKSEYEYAVKNYGDKYSSLHEGYAVLKEEVDEARDEQIYIKNDMYDLWRRVKLNDVQGAEEDIEHIKKHAEKLALEAVQIAAVCNKILNGL